MPIRVTCPGCQRGISAPDKMAGKSAKCPHCASPISVPALAATDVPRPQAAAEFDPLAVIGPPKPPPPRTAKPELPTPDVDPPPPTYIPPAGRPTNVTASPQAVAAAKPEPPKRYPNLRAYLMAMRIIVTLAAVIMTAMLVYRIYRTRGLYEDLLPGWIASFGILAFMYIAANAAIELIYVLIDIESNTRKSSLRE